MATTARSANSRRSRRSARARGTAGRSVPTKRAYGFVVLERVGPDRWRMIGEVARRPGMPARAARRHAIETAIGRRLEPGDAFIAILRSEWNIGLDY